MSNQPSIPALFRKVDLIALPDHFYLAPDDVCYYLWEWIKGAHYEKNLVNSFIKNFQIGVQHKDSTRWHYKAQAMYHAASALAKTLNNDWVERGTFVPIPPSRTKGDPHHDPRLFTTLKGLIAEPPLDVRELVLQRENTESKQKQVTPQDRAANWYIDEQIVGAQEPSDIFVFDDMLTTGSHYKGMEIILRNRFPAARIFGIFLTRRIFPSDSEIDFDGI